MLEEATEARKEEVVKFADIKSTILNTVYGPYLKKGDYYPYKIDMFLPKDFLPKQERKPISKAEKNKRWSAAGHAMMDDVNKINREMRGRR